MTSGIGLAAKCLAAAIDDIGVDATVTWLTAHSVSIHDYWSADGVDVVCPSSVAKVCSEDGVPVDAVGSRRGLWLLVFLVRLVFFRLWFRLYVGMRRPVRLGGC